MLQHLNFALHCFSLHDQLLEEILLVLSEHGLYLLLRERRGRAIRVVGQLGVKGLELILDLLEQLHFVGYLSA